MQYQDEDSLPLRTFWCFNVTLKSSFYRYYALTSVSFFNIFWHFLGKLGTESVSGRLLNTLYSGRSPLYNYFGNSCSWKDNLFWQFNRLVPCLVLDTRWDETLAWVDGKHFTHLWACVGSRIQYRKVLKGCFKTINKTCSENFPLMLWTDVLLALALKMDVFSRR